MIENNGNPNIKKGIYFFLDEEWNKKLNFFCKKTKVSLENIVKQSLKVYFLMIEKKLIIHTNKNIKQKTQ
jgi:hypothetical protein